MLDPLSMNGADVGRSVCRVQARRLAQAGTARSTRGGMGSEQLGAATAPEVQRPLGVGGNDWAPYWAARRHAGYEAFHLSVVPPPEHLRLPCPPRNTTPALRFSPQVDLASRALSELRSASTIHHMVRVVLGAAGELVVKATRIETGARVAFLHPVRDGGGGGTRRRARARAGGEQSTSDARGAGAAGVGRGAGREDCEAGQASSWNWV